MRRYFEIYKEIERLEEGYNDVRNIKEEVILKDKGDKRWLCVWDLKFFGWVKKKWNEGF